MRPQAVSIKVSIKGKALGISEKSENFDSLRPILFELCKKNYRNRVKGAVSVILSDFSCRGGRSGISTVTFNL